MLPNFERHREIEFAQTQATQGLIEVPTYNVRSVNGKAAAVCVIAVDSDNPFSAAISEYLEPESGAAADIDNGTNRENVEHEIDDNRGGLEILSLFFFEPPLAWSIGLSQQLGPDY